MHAILFIAFKYSVAVMVLLIVDLSGSECILQNQHITFWCFDSVAMPVASLTASAPCLFCSLLSCADSEFVSYADFAGQHHCHWSVGE